jgi:hypothetical protein
LRVIAAASSVAVGHATALRGRGLGMLPIITKVVGVRELVDAALNQSAESVGMIYQRCLQPREVCQNPFDHLAIFRA